MPDACQACIKASMSAACGELMAACEDCRVRDISRGPSFHESERLGRMTAEYRRALQDAFGKRWAEMHKAVKAEHAWLQAERSDAVT